VTGSISAGSGPHETIIGADGTYVYLGAVDLAGDVIDTTSRKIVTFLPPLHDSTQFIEIDWRHGRPVAATSRYGVGYPADGR
jgi:hypothetical protein